MRNLQDFLKALNDLKEALIALTSTVSIAIVCVPHHLGKAYKKEVARAGKY